MSAQSAYVELFFTGNNAAHDELEVRFSWFWQARRNFFLQVISRVIKYD